jgi:hypothetical protein
MRLNIGNLDLISKVTRCNLVKILSSHYKENCLCRVFAIHTNDCFYEDLGCDCIYMGNLNLISRSPGALRLIKNLVTLETELLMLRIWNEFTPIIVHRWLWPISRSPDAIRSNLCYHIRKGTAYARHLKSTLIIVLAQCMLGFFIWNSCIFTNNFPCTEMSLPLV